MPRLLRAFTLIELIIVMGILGILMALGVSNFQGARIKARDAKRKSDLATIAKSLEAYANDYGKYPRSNNGVIICDDANNTTCAWNSSFKDSKGTIYTAVLPEDPTTGSGRKYRYESTAGVSYILYAALENSRDPSIITINGIDCGSGSTPCNYRIKSSNDTTP